MRRTAARSQDPFPYDTLGTEYDCWVIIHAVCHLFLPLIGCSIYSLFFSDFASESDGKDIKKLISLVRTYPQSLPDAYNKPYRGTAAVGFVNYLAKIDDGRRAVNSEGTSSGPLCPNGCFILVLTFGVTKRFRCFNIGWLSWWILCTLYPPPWTRSIWKDSNAIESPLL